MEKKIITELSHKRSEASEILTGSCCRRSRTAKTVNSSKEQDKGKAFCSDVRKIFTFLESNKVNTYN